MVSATRCLLLVPVPNPRNLVERPITNPLRTLLLAQEVDLPLLLEMLVLLRHQAGLDLCETSEIKLQDQLDIILTARRGVYVLVTKATFAM